MYREINFTLGSFKFSAGHFTIFSATERESLHGHSYILGAKVCVDVDSGLGLNFDYRKFKAAMRQLCKQFNTKFLLPSKSPFLELLKLNEHVQITFNGQSMQLLRDDVVFLPLTNVTIELLSGYLLSELLAENSWLQQCSISKISLEIANGLQQSATAYEHLCDELT